MCFLKKMLFSKKSVYFILFNVSRSNISLVFFYVSVTNIYLIFFLFINENYLSLDFCINDEYVLCFFQYFSITNFCHVLFLNIFTKKSTFFIFCCIRNKYQSWIFYLSMTNICPVFFIFINGQYLFHIFYASPENIYPMIYFIFIIINDKYVSHFFNIYQSHILFIYHVFISLKKIIRWSNSQIQFNFFS